MDNKCVLAKWTPCSERRPPEGVKVLIQKHDDEITVGSYEGMHERIGSGRNNVEIREQVPRWYYPMGSVGSIDPVAWMPLPSPYQPKESEEG